MKKDRFSKQIKRFSNSNLMGGYIKRFANLYTILLFVIGTVELVFFVRELFIGRNNQTRHYLYLFSYVVLFASSIANAIFLITQRKRENNEKLITIIIHIYALVGLVWAVVISISDYIGHGEFPVVFFTLIAGAGGLIILNPFIYVPSMFLAVATLIASMYLIDPSFLTTGNVINMVILFVVIATVSWRTSAVAVSDEDTRNWLYKISMIDTLTGLKNENAYYRYLDKLDDATNKGLIKEYAVIVMDVNGMKYTDDTYGHRFGAHLISCAGRLLPIVFRNCDIFHTGGDEFVCIITKEFNKLDEYLNTFSDTLEYQIVFFEGQELFLSLARGVAIHQDGEKFNETYQRADRDMYVNKPIIKEKYNIQGR